MFLLLVLLLIGECFCVPTFSSEPSNVTVLTGHSAVMTCTLQGTSAFPLWRLNSQHSYSVSSLPAGLKAVGTGLRIDASVVLDYNQSSFQCYAVFIANGGFSQITSTIGFLTVISPSVTVMDACCVCTCSESKATIESSSLSEYSSIFPIVTNYTSGLVTLLPHSSVHHSADEYVHSTNTPKPAFSQSNVAVIIAPTICVVVAMLMGLIVSVSCIYLWIYKSRKSIENLRISKEQPTMKMNECYVSGSQIKRELTENQDYATVM